MLLQTKYKILQISIPESNENQLRKQNQLDKNRNEVKKNELAKSKENQELENTRKEDSEIT